MKLTRRELKSILKECIQELIEEGAFDQVLAESVPPGGDVNFQQSLPQGEFAGGQVGSMVSPQALGGSGFTQQRPPTLQQYSQDPQAGWASMGQGSPADRLRQLARDPGDETGTRRVPVSPPRGGYQEKGPLWEQIFADSAERVLSGEGLPMGAPSPDITIAREQEQLGTLAPEGNPRIWAQVAFAGKRK